ncbi:MAG TPA: hypothetical protein VK939_08950 [Longimicrobiales bacterium]|nr:hypothetical protein [Longimicrobiales bacterium]
MLLGIHRNTAFRWRHRILDEAPHHEPVPLLGMVEVADTRFPFSEKGRRRTVDGKFAGDAYSSSSRLDRRRVSVSIALDRSGRFAGAITGMRRPVVVGLRACFEARIARGATVLTSDGRFSAHATCARGLGLDVWSGVAGTPPVRELVHTATARRFITEFRGWLKRFRGVSTYYLENYVWWFAILRRVERSHGCAELLHWSLAPPEPTIPDDTARAVADT